MNYISLDLEWNQAYAQKALAVQKRLACRLRGEVIQIGAVKLDSDLNIIGSYRTTVRPKYFRTIHRHVMRLTGIDQNMIDHGTPLPDAIDRFRRWCGEDFAFLTWGPDDIPMLEDNLRVHRLDGAWLHRTYDLQRIYNAQQTDHTKSQPSLEHAMEHFGIEQNLPAHDALNDAYFTALVARKLDIAAGVASYEESRQDGALASGVVGDADTGGKGFPSPEELLKAPAFAAPVCPLCENLLTPEGDLLHARRQRYARLYRCNEHGKMLLRIHLVRNFDETWRAKYALLTADADTEADYRRRLAAAESFATLHKRRKRHSLRKTADTTHLASPPDASVSFPQEDG